MPKFKQMEINGTLYDVADKDIRNLTTAENAGKVIGINEDGTGLAVQESGGGVASITETFDVSDWTEVDDKYQYTTQNAGLVNHIYELRFDGEYELVNSVGVETTTGANILVSDVAFEGKVELFGTNATYESNTLAGYGITDAYTKTQVDNIISGKQDTLVSGTNIKTINNQSILGSGNITISGGGGVTVIIQQKEHELITVTCGGVEYTETFSVEPGMTITAITVVSTHEGYNAGSGTINGSTSYSLPMTLLNNILVSATQATVKTFQFTITQSTGQTITVTCNGTQHTTNFTVNYGDEWTAVLVASPSYEAGELSASSGTVTGATEVHATPAIFTGPIWPNYMTSESGRKFGRHATLPGTVMQWNDKGTTRTTLVLDAQYRGKYKSYKNDSTNLNLTQFKVTGYPTDSSVSLPASASVFTDTLLNSKAMSSQDTRTNKVATDEWRNSSYYSDTDMPAVNYVRNTLNTQLGTAFDLPTINCLTRIYGDMVILDNMDPTVSSYSQYSLASWFGRDGVWSASWYGNDNYYCALYVFSSSNVNSRYLVNSSGVVPVLDIG